MKYLTEKQVGSLFDGLDKNSKFFVRNQALVTFMVSTGLRVAEATGLNIGDVLNDQGKVRDELVVRKEIAKNGKERMVPLNNDAKKAICTIMQFNDSEKFVINAKSALIISRKHCRITPRQIQRIIENARNKADLDVKATPHTLRHTFAKTLYENTNRVTTVQRILGHNSLKTTMIYTEASKEEMIEQVNTLHFAPK